MARWICWTLLLVVAGTAHAFNLGFLGDSVMQRMTAQDAQSLSDAMGQALRAAEEGAVREWNNPESGASGTITVQRIYQRDGRGCRSLQIRTTAQAVKAQGVYRFCQLPDGEWTFAAP